MELSGRVFIQTKRNVAHWDCENKTDDKFKYNFQLFRIVPINYKSLRKEKLRFKWNRPENVSNKYKKWITTWSQSEQLTMCRSYMKKCATNNISET